MVKLFKPILDFLSKEINPCRSYTPAVFSISCCILYLSLWPLNAAWYTGLISMTLGILAFLMFIAKPALQILVKLLDQELSMGIKKGMEIGFKLGVDSLHEAIKKHYSNKEQIDVNQDQK